MRLFVVLIGLACVTPVLAQNTNLQTRLLTRGAADALAASATAHTLPDGTVLVKQRPQPAGHPGLCSQEVLRIPPADARRSPQIRVEVETTYRSAWDARPGRSVDERHQEGLRAACESLPDVTAKAPDARTAWLAAYAVELVREQLELSRDDILTQLCLEGSTQCRDTRLLLEIVKRDQIVFARPVPCRKGGQACVEAIGFFDPYASKIAGKALFVKLHAELVSSGGSAWSLRSATLEETLLDPVDDG